MKPKVCYLDCTETITYNNNTGIQRCVRNILSRLASVQARHETVVYPVIAIMGKYYRYDISRNARMVRILSNGFAAIRNMLDSLRTRLGGGSPLTGTKTNSDQANNYVSFIQVCRRIMPLFYWVAYQLDGVLVERRSIRIGDGDILFIADAFWNENTLQALDNYRCKNVYLLLYDVIPLMVPQLCDDSHVYNFKNNFDGIVSRLTGIITISRSEMANVAAYCTFINTNIIYDYFYLGADFVEDYGENVLNSVVEDVFRQGSVYIIVGTIEPRKNHECVLEAFETLWRRGLDVTLCIIGKIGWKSSEILTRIRHHSQLGKKLFMLNGISDQELVYCYARCTGVVFASLAEGFGLPLVEGMHSGKLVLASDIPVFREVGGDYPAYFSPHDPSQLVSLVTKIENGEIRLPSPRSWITWDESIEMLFGKLFAVKSNAVLENNGQKT